MAKKEETKTSKPAKKPVTKKVSFEYPAPDAHQVYLSGEFNDWDGLANPMKKDKKGIWKTTVSLAPGRYQYRFLIDGRWENDPACSDFVSNDFGTTNCVRIVD